MTAEESVALIINGDPNGHSYAKRKTPLSFVSARLVHAIDKVRSLERSEIITAHFFCGLHDTYEESWECPSGVVNSLLAQLLTQYRNTKDIKIESPEGLKSHKIRAVFGYFERIIKQLPEGVTVFCVIDSVSTYVNLPEIEGDAKWLISNLLWLATTEPPEKATFKLLLTAPNSLRVRKSKLRGSEVLNVSERPPRTGGFNDVQWDSAIGDKLERALKKMTGCWLGSFDFTLLS